MNSLHHMIIERNDDTFTAKERELLLHYARVYISFTPNIRYLPLDYLHTPIPYCLFLQIFLPKHQAVLFEAMAVLGHRC